MRHKRLPLPSVARPTAGFAQTAGCGGAPHAVRNPASPPHGEASSWLATLEVRCGIKSRCFTLSDLSLMLPRLYFRIYLAVLGSLLVFAFAVGILWRNIGETTYRKHSTQMLLQAAQNVLPPASASASWQQLALGEITRNMHVDLSLFAADRTLLASVGQTLPPPEATENGVSISAQFRPSPIWTMELPDGRWLRARPTEPDMSHGHRPPFEGMAFVGALLLLLLVVGFAAHPIARRITRRLEKLQQGVDALGRGDLKARVAVQGHDEVAALATSFNRAATRIEALVTAHRLLLANTSHELRTPLTRIRLAIELQKKDFDSARLAALEQDIQELDAMIEGILLSSRLDASTQSQTFDDVDMLALAAEECARFSSHEIDVSGEPVVVRGDAALLRRLIRNLVDNAMRHGKAPVEITVRKENGHALLCVTDHGAGVPADAIANMFEPFNRVQGARTAGTGLGLSLVKKIAQHHNGDVRLVANSAANGGAESTGKFSVEVRI
ncbi:MAG: HAMP domain-containing histidine kinase [Rhodocyclaceae bacterium]|nr:HAMP domain-containing histidine kinase [Rhodocyclaceae bacterium]